MRVFAIADLHLGFSTGKWMDRFGDHWKGHHEKVEKAWRERIEANDIVVLPGDFSWAMKPAEVAEEFDWLARLPGKKVLTKGNHDYWWPKSRTKLEALLPPDCHAIKKRAVRIDGVPFITARGADFMAFEDKPVEDIEAALDREERELLASIADLERVGEGRVPPVALFHYPPIPIDEDAAVGPPDRFSRHLEAAGCRWCVYGHLHSREEWERVFQGERGGVRYRLVSCDSLDFVPELLFELPDDDDASGS